MSVVESLDEPRIAQGTSGSQVVLVGEESPASTIRNPDSVSPMVEYRLYKRRWFMLLVVCLMNFSNAMLWISFAPIANYSDDYYCVTKDCHAADMLSMVFMIITIPVGFFAMWSVDKFGLRLGILCGSWLNVVGAAIRVISTIPQMQKNDARYGVALTGQCIAAAAQPFMMFLPTKLAALWFADDGRTTANTLGSMSNPIGILAAMSVVPYMVTRASGDQLQVLNLVLFAICGVTVVLATFGVRSSLPPTPPTFSAASMSPPYFQALKSLIRNRAFIVLAACLGNGIGAFNAVFTLIQQILCTKGYSNSFAGWCGVALIASGFLGSLISGMIVDRTKLFAEVAKICYALASVATCAFAILSLHSSLVYPVGISVAIFGFFGFAMFPICLEMGVECTYPVAEATSSGIIIIAGQIFGIIYLLAMSNAASNASPQDLAIETCTRGAALNVVPQSWTVPNMIFCGGITLIGCAFILGFWPKFKRLEAETQMKQRAKALLHNEERSISPSPVPQNPATKF